MIPRACLDPPQLAEDEILPRFFLGLGLALAQLWGLWRRQRVWFVLGRCGGEFLLLLLPWHVAVGFDHCALRVVGGPGRVVGGYGHRFGLGVAGVLAALLDFAQHPGDAVLAKE